MALHCAVLFNTAWRRILVNTLNTAFDGTKPGQRATIDNTAAPHYSVQMLQMYNHASGTVLLLPHFSLLLTSLTSTK